jgi:hypothetical protein
MKKNDKKYFCKLCDFITCKKTNYDIHILTQKHIINVLATNSNTETTKKILKCERCQKIYNDRSGLWRHKTKGKCIKNQIQNFDSNSNYGNESEFEYEKNNKNDSLTNKDLIMMLIKENSELKNMMIKVLENGTYNNNYTHNITNSHNKSFNLQFFLNETCKDAMNITDFVDSLKLQLSDLEKVGEVGYIEGISNIIIQNLKEMDITQRPVHCTDKKRETLYIKDEDKWEKDEEKLKMHKLVRKVADKNARLLPKFKEKYPDYNKSSSKISDQFNKIIIESMGGRGDDDYEKEEKIIRNISKQIVIEKEINSIN